MAKHNLSPEAAAAVLLTAQSQQSCTVGLWCACHRGTSIELTGPDESATAANQKKQRQRRRLMVLRDRTADVAERAELQEEIDALPAGLVVLIPIPITGVTLTT